MKYAICNELYGDWPFEEAFAHAHNCGYQGIEIAPFTINPDVAQIGAAERIRIRNLAEQNQLKIVGLHWLLAQTNGYHLTHPDAQIRNKTAKYLVELARFCSDLGGEIMVFGSPRQRNLHENVTYQQGVDYAIDVLKRTTEALEQLDVTLALEPLGPEEGDFMLTARSGIEIAQAVNSPMVKLHLDVKAMSTESKPIPDIIRDSRDWLVHFHANDPNRQGPGMGDTDFEPIYEALKAISYDGWISVEVFDYQPGIEALSGQSLRYLKMVEAKTA